MFNRDSLIQLRPSIPSIKENGYITPVEHFQNTTLRPILKQQNEIILSIYSSFIDKNRHIYNLLTFEQKEHFIRQSLQKDIILKNILLGSVLSIFTIKEYNEFITQEKELKKRINEMLIQRLQDQMGKFE